VIRARLVRADSKLGVKKITGRSRSANVASDTVIFNVDIIPLSLQASRRNFDWFKRVILV